MPEVKVTEVESADQLNEFIKFPYRLYAGDNNFVPPLIIERKEFFDKKQNPFYHTALTRMFLAHREGKLVGRIATCISYRHNEYHNEQTGFFGFLDTIDNKDVAHSLLKVAMIELKKAGMDRMRGPMNFTTNHECGFLIEGFDSPPMVMMSYNYPYQVKLAEDFGLKKVMDLLAYKLPTTHNTSDRVSRVVARQSERLNIKIRTLDMNNFLQEVRMIKGIYNSAWARNWGFIPMNEAEFDHVAKNLKQIIDPDIVIIAEMEGKPAGFALALPNINQALIRLKGRLFPTGLFKLLWHTKIRNKIDQCRLVTFGVVPEYRKRAIDMMLYMECHKRCLEKGYKWGELSWILETNDGMRHGVEQMQAKVYKRYRVLEMPL